MTREQLNNLILSFAEHDTQAKVLKKVCDADKLALKQEFSTLDTNELSYGGWTVKYSTYEKETVDENAMLALLKEDWIARNGDEECPYIKTREYLDTDVLESYMYRGDIPESTTQLMSNCIETKTIEKILISKTKQEKATFED